MRWIVDNEQELRSYYDTYYHDNTHQRFDKKGTLVRKYGFVSADYP
jgi:hypothetical protein